MRTISVLILFLVFTTIAFSQDQEQILQKNFEAHDFSARKNASGLLTTGHFIMSGTDLQVPFKLFQKRPDRIRIETSLFGMKVVQTYDGKEAWLLNPAESMQAKEADGEDLEVIAMTTAIEGPFMLYKEKGYRMQYLGDESFRDKKVYQFRFLKTESEYLDIYINQQTYRVDAVRFTYERNGGRYSQVYRTGRYKRFDTGYFPTEIVAVIHGVEMTKIYVKDVMEKSTFSDKLFKRPGVHP